MIEAKLRPEGTAYVLHDDTGTILGSVVPHGDEHPFWWTVAYQGRTRDMFESYDPRGGDQARLDAAVRVMQRAVRP